METYLISPNFVRECTNISSNMQDKFLMSAIREASDIDYQEIVGTSLYNRLKELIADDSILNPQYIAYKQLLDISKYYLAYSVVTRLVVISSIKLDNIGANQTGDEKANPLSIKDVFTTENYYHNKADFYKRRLQEYLYNNMDKLKELDGCICDGLRANLHSASHCSVFLGGARGKKNNRFKHF